MRFATSGEIGLQNMLAPKKRKEKISCGGLWAFEVLPRFNLFAI